MGQKLWGFVGQGVGGGKSYRDARLSLQAFPTIATTGTGSISAPRACRAMILAWGPGGSGSAGNTPSGGGGGAAIMCSVSLARGQSISWTIGTPGPGAADLTDGSSATDTVVTLPGGILRAGGGGGGFLAGSTPGSGGVAIGVGAQRPGAAGLAGTSGSSGAAGSFSEIDLSLAGGVSGATPGAGSQGATGGPASQAGGQGRVIIVLGQAV